MTPLVWANFLAALVFVLAFAGIPLWMTFKRPQGRPDFSEARSYLAAKAALAQRTGPPAPRLAPASRATAGNGPARRHDATAPARHRPARARRKRDASV